MTPVVQGGPARERPHQLPQEGEQGCQVSFGKAALLAFGFVVTPL